MRRHLLFCEDCNLPASITCASMDEPALHFCAPCYSSHVYAAHDGVALPGCRSLKEVEDGLAAGDAMSIPTREEVKSFSSALRRICPICCDGLSDKSDCTPVRMRWLDADAALRAEIERIRGALVAAAEHHVDEAKSRRGSAHYHAERARVLRAAAEGKP